MASGHGQHEEALIIGDKAQATEVLVVAPANESVPGSAAECCRAEAEPGRPLAISASGTRKALPGCDRIPNTIVSALLRLHQG